MIYDSDGLPQEFAELTESPAEAAALPAIMRTADSFRASLALQQEVARAPHAWFSEEVDEKWRDPQAVEEWAERHDVPTGFAQFRVDFMLISAWDADPLWKIAIEIDGRTWHEADSQKEQDRKKDAWLARNGFGLIRFPASMPLHYPRSFEALLKHRVHKILKGPDAFFPIPRVELTGRGRELEERSWVECEQHGGWFWVELGSWECHLFAYHPVTAGTSGPKEDWEAPS